MLLGLSSPTDFARYERDFDSSISSFAQLTDQSKLNRQPERLRIATVSGAKTMRQALQNEGIPTNRIGEFSILNGMMENQMINSGTLIKVLAR